METLGVVLAVVFGVVLPLAMVFLWMKLKGLVQGLAFDGLEQPPARIHLRPTAAGFQAVEEVDALTDDLSVFGFSVDDDYEVPEMGMMLRGLTHPDGWLGLVYEHAHVGIWVDIVGLTQPGVVTASNTPMGGAFDHPPGHCKVVQPGAAVSDLVGLARREVRSQPLHRVGDFAATVERAYAEEMDWRLARGVTSEEVRRVAAQMHGEFDDEVLETTRKLLQEQYTVMLEAPIVEHFLASGTITALEWERVRDWVVIVHDKMSPDQIRGIWLDEVDEEPPQTDQSSARALFAGFNTNGVFRKLGEVEQPLGADLYVGPDAPRGSSW